MRRVVLRAVASVCLFAGGVGLWGVAGETLSPPLVVGAFLSWLAAILAAFDAVIGGLELRRKAKDLPPARIVKSG